MPAPPATVSETEPGRVYVMFAAAEQCSKAHAGVAVCYAVLRASRSRPATCASASIMTCACMLGLLSSLA